MILAHPQILRNCYKAIPEDGKVLIVDAVIEQVEGTKRKVGLLFDMCMMPASTILFHSLIFLSLI